MDKFKRVFPAIVLLVMFIILLFVVLPVGDAVLATITGFIVSALGLLFFIVWFKYCIIQNKKNNHG